MANTNILQLSLKQLCQATELPTEIVFEIVEEGIIDPVGDPVGESPENWTFDVQMITVAKKAFRLHRDLDIDWSGIALAISLLDELEQLRAENQQLQRRLRRFIDPG